MKREYLTPEEVAAELKLSKYTVYEMVKRGEIPASKIGRALRILRTDLDLLIKGNKTRPEERRGPGGKVSDVIGKETLHEILFAGSHDLSIDLLAQHLSVRGITLLPIYAGSLEGLIELYKGRTELAGCHLLAKEQGEYNLPYVTSVLPNEEVTVINFLHRWQGFIVPKGNPKMITSWEAFFFGTHRIVNRQKGSGTRVLLDQKIHQLQIPPSSIKGYDHEGVNHYATALAVLKGEADAALGIESVARSMQLDFFPIQQERYDFVVPTKLLPQERFQIMLEVLKDSGFRQAVVAQGGYDVSQMGEEIMRFS